MRLVSGRLQRFCCACSLSWRAARLERVSEVSASGRQAAALGDQCVILGISLRSVGFESRIRHFPISLLARPDRIDLSFSAPLPHIDTIDASTIEAEHLLLERRRKLRVAVRFGQRRSDLEASEGLDLILR